MKTEEEYQQAALEDITDLRAVSDTKAEDMPPLLDELPVHKMTHGNSDHTLEEKVQAAVAFAITGSVAKAAKITGIPRGAIRNWQTYSPWWEDALREIRKRKNDELDAKATRIMHGVLDELSDRLEHGDVVITKNGEKVNKPITARDAALVLGVVHDKRALLRGDPTSIKKAGTDESRLKKIQERMEDMTKKYESSMKEIKGSVVREQ